MQTFSKSFVGRLAGASRRSVLRVSVSLLGLLFTVALATNTSLHRTLIYAQSRFVRPHVSASPRVTGSDGSQTGVASFQGAFTAISESGNNLFLLQRQSDCSINLINATSATNGTSVSFSLTSNTPHYERTLHQLASLNTNAGVYPHGCAEKNAGISTRSGVYVGVAKGGSNVSAQVVSYGNGTAVRTRIYIGLTGAVSNFETSLSNASALTTADLNGDGNNDLIVVNDYLNNAPYVSIMLGKSDGTFQSPVDYTIAGNMSVAAVVDDLNGDGKLDIVAVSDDQQISVLTGNGDGTFNAAVSFPAPIVPGYSSTTSTPIYGLITADVNNDGKKDLICSDGIVLLGKGDGTFTALSTPAFPVYNGVTSGLGPGMASGDLNNDGNLDLVVNTGGSLTTWIGKGDGTFSQGKSYTSTGNLGYVTVSDFDGDGNLDIYSGLANGGLYSGDSDSPASAYVLMGNGDGSFQGAQQVQGAYNGANLGDVNGDGTPDIITNATGQSNQTLPTFTVQLGNGKGAFTSASTITAPASFTATTSALTSPVTINNANTVGATSYAVADVNGDGKADLVFVDNGLAAINPGNGFPITYPAPIYFVALSNGDGTFAAPLPYNFPQIAPASGFDNSVTASTVQIADFNHDGHPDLLFTYNDQAGGPGTVPYYQGFAILTGKGDGTFSTTPILTSTYSSTSAPTTAFVPTVLSTADLNGDNKPDLIVNTPGTVITNFQLQTATQIYIGNGDGTFKTPTTIPAANEYGIPVVADLNKDGKLDLAFLAETSTAQAELVVALGNGDGTFATPTVFNLSGGDAIRSSGLAAADFDNDGNIDLALLESAAFSGVFYGKGDGTFTSVPLGGNIVPKDLINLAAGGTSTALDLNKDGKPDLLVGNTVLLNIYGAVSTPPTLTTTSTALTASATTISTGASITFTATLTPASGPTGTVTFYDGSTSLGTGTIASGTATYTTTALTTGSHNITAVYSGDTAYSTSTSSIVPITVNTVPAVATTTTLTASATSAPGGTTLDFIAIVTPASGTTPPTGTVTFYDGSTVLGTGPLGSAPLPSTGRATFSTSTLSVGSHTITASYGGATTFSTSTSTGLTITITPAIPPDFSISFTPTSSTTARGTRVNTTVTITPIGIFKQTVQLSATGAPANSTVTISPASITSPDGTLTASAIVTFNATGTASISSHRPSNIELAITLPFGFLLTTTLFGRRRRWPLQLITLATAVILLTAAGCGHSPSPPTTNTPTPGTYTITVTGTSGTLVHTAPWTVSVQ